MSRRVIAFFTSMSILMCFLCYRVYDITQGSYASAQRSGSTVTLEINKTRGIFYDCNMERLTDRETEKLAVIVPTTQALAAIRSYFSMSEAEMLLKRLSHGKPIITRVSNNFSSATGATIFQVSKRYGEEPLAPHIIGYLDSGNQNGIAGLEKVFDNWLKKEESVRSITYDVDASGRVLAGNKPVIQENSRNSQHGVKLTIDTTIQQIAQHAAKQINSGAVVVMEVETGAIRAVVSTPAFHPEQISKSLTDDGSPFINRAFRGYSLGSIFKIVTAAAAIENQVFIEEPFVCTGSTTAGGTEFRCYQETAHGEVTMESALEKSCNSYFIQLALAVGKEKLLAQAQKMGLGQVNKLADGLVSASGLLPKAADVDSDAALANLAFGQGNLLVTPLQAAAMISCVANGGYYVQPQLIEGLVANDGTMEKEESHLNKNRVMRQSTADIISQYLIHAMENNYSHIAAPKHAGAGGKTATAQSGWYRENREVLHTWFAGFYPARHPQYAVVVMNEDGKFGASDCCPVFQEIADGLYEQGLINTDGYPALK